MGRLKGGKNRKYSTAEKLRVVKRYFESGLGIVSLGKEENVPHSTLEKWINRYLEDGESGLINKKKVGNAFSALHTSKSLSEVERLRLTVAKQEIQIERLKKGYLVKGVGANKAFVILKDVNSK
jgi:transposase-like protein